MPGWIVQTIFPDFLALTLKVPLVLVPLLKPAPVTLCGALPVHLKTRRVPFFTVRVFGSKKLSPSLMVFDDAPNAGMATAQAIASDATRAMSLRMGGTFLPWGDLEDG